MLHFYDRDVLILSEFLLRSILVPICLELGGQVASPFLILLEDSSRGKIRTKAVSLEME